MPSKERYKNIVYSDVESPEAFRVWLKVNLPNLYNKKEIPN